MLCLSEHTPASRTERPEMANIKLFITICSEIYTEYTLGPVFHFECRKVIGSASLRLTIGLKNSRRSLIQSEARPKPIVRRSQAFSRALRSLHVFTSTVYCVVRVLCDWLE